MKKILLPTDFSSCALNAADFAYESAKILPAEIIVLHAFELSGSVYTDYMGVNKEYDQTLWEEAKRRLEGLKNNIEQRMGVKVTAQMFKGGLKEAIAETALTEKADLIVMGTLGAGGIMEKLIGSKTASVIGSSPVPVIAIPIHYRWKKPVKILLATRKFEKDPALLNPVFELADQYMAQVEVVVFTDEDDDQAGDRMAQLRKISPYEQMLKERYREDELRVTHLYGLEFEETLRKYTSEQEADMLVMITYEGPEGFWKRLFHPGRTKNMSYHTSIPLMAIPARRLQPTKKQEI